MESPSITIKRIGGYVVVISMLLLGSIMSVWWVLSNQLTTKTYDTQSLVNYSSPSTQETSLFNSDSYVITSQDILNATIQSQDIAQATIKRDNLHPTIEAWLNSFLSEGLSTLGLTVQDLIGKVEETTGIELTDITSLQILDGTIGLDDLEAAIVDTLGSVGTIADNSVTSLKIADGAIQNLDIASGAITGLLLADGTIGSTDIAIGAIGTDLLAPDAVTSDKIADGIIGAGHIAAGVINGSLIQDGSITATDLALGIINGGLIANDSIDEAHILDDAITGVKILDGTINAADIASGVLGGDLITDGSITIADLASGSVGTLQIGDGAVTSLKISDGTITASDILNGAIGTLQLGDSSVTSSKINDGAITIDDLASGSVGTLQLVGGSVQTSKLSTASNKKTVSAQIGDVSVVLGDIERAIFVAPTAGTITKVTFTNGLNVTAGVNKGVLSVERKTATTATVASVDLGSVSLTGFAPQSPSLVGGTTFSTGDVYSFKWDAGLIGVALTGFLVTIEYVPSE